MKLLQRTLAISLAALLLLNSTTPVRACGPYFTEPIFVFENSPDLPFNEFTNGKIGIVLPTFGRKTLVIAYRYLNGGSFTSDEQAELIGALKGKAPEDDGTAAVKAWVKARKEVFGDDDKLPEIYTERQHGEGYDFFPNCTRNAFEVATETLKDRVTRYGAEDKNVHTWLAAQDTVFQNCSRGAQVPNELGAESPEWLRKDREYQIAAAHFYSLNFDEARARFEKIAADVDSPWQELAAYLVARTLVRQASLAGTEELKRAGYERVEAYLQIFLATGGKYAPAGQRLLALVKYHLHPEERVVELARGLAEGSDDNLRQDLIDYVWLLDKFESRILKAEEERTKKSELESEKHYESLTLKMDEEYERIQRGEAIQIWAPIKKANSSESPGFSITFNYDTPQPDILAAFEHAAGRKLTNEETSQIKQLHDSALQDRQWRISPNRKWDNGVLSPYEGENTTNLKLTLALLPDFLRADDLSGWILTLQTDDPRAYSHAFRKWRETGSPAWLTTAMIKARKSSPSLVQLMRAAEKVMRDDPSYATVAYHLVRLKLALGNVTAARKLLDEIISWQTDVFPLSAQNQFLEQRMSLAETFSDFLKSAQRKPVAFFKYGAPEKISDLIKSQKRAWNPDYEKSKEEWDREVDLEYADLLPWDDRFTFDSKTADILNTHFPLQLLVKAARDPDLPDYLQGRLVLAIWTRAVLLKNDDVALKIAPEVVKFAPKTEPVFKEYLEARTVKERREAALWVLLKFPDLSPYLSSIIPTFDTSEDVDYYFDTKWWCAPEETDYNEQGVEVPRVVPKPSFLTAAQLEAARREYRALAEIDDAKSYLGRRVVAWAKASPDNPKIPEALFIAARATEAYKNGCASWEHDEATQQAAEKLLKQRYPSSPWTAKLRESAEN
jgi:hypothetical protein